MEDMEKKMEDRASELALMLLKTNEEIDKMLARRDAHEAVISHLVYVRNSKGKS